MKEKKLTHEQIRKITLVGILTALTAVLSLIQIPIMGVTVTLVLPVVVIGGAIAGPYVGAWLMVVPSIVYTVRDAQIFFAYSPFGCILTMILKGLLAGFLAALAYKALAKKHPTGAVFLSAVVAPVVNSGVFTLGAYIFFWDALIEMAETAGVSITVLLLGLVIINFVIEVILNLVLCPTILRIIKFGKKEQ